MSSSKGIITLIFINKNERMVGSGGYGERDDTITIRKNVETDNFSVVYKDANAGGPPVIHTMTLEHDDVVDHMYLVLKSQALDDDGFESIQFNLPAMPRLLVNISRLNEMYYREHLLELIQNGLDCLDAMSPTPEEEEWICDDCTERLETEARIEAKNQELREDAVLEAEIAEAEGRTAWWRAVARKADAKAVKADAAAVKADVEAQAAVRWETEAAAHSKVRIAESQARGQAQQQAQQQCPASYCYDVRSKKPAEPPALRRSSRLCSSNSVRSDPFEA